MLGFFDLLPFSQIGFHIKLACFVLFMSIFLPFLRLWLYFSGVEWLQELWPVEIRANEIVKIYQLQIVYCFFVVFVAFIEIYTIKRKYWAYIANLILSVIFLMGGLFNFSWITVIFAYPLFVLTQKSSGKYFFKNTG